MKISIYILLLATWLLTACHEYPGGKPEALTIDLMKDPGNVAIGDASPEFGWQYRSDKTSDYQTAYQILVSSSRNLIELNKGDIWNSGKVISGTSANVEFRGIPLEPLHTYYWKVRLWDRDGQSTRYSDEQAFTTGVPGHSYTTIRHPLVRKKIKPVTILRKPGSDYFIDFGKDAFGTLEVTLTSPARDTLEIHLGEKLISPGTIDRDPGGTIRYKMVHLPLSPGKHTYVIRLKPDQRNTGVRAIHLPESIGVVMPFRYCEIIRSPSVITPSDISRITVFYPFDERSSFFTSSDTTLNRIWNLCKYSIKATSFTGVYIDGDRERIPYEADAYINQLGHYCTDEEFNMARFSHEYLITHPTWPTEWIMHSVLMAYADYMYTGNTESLEQYYDDLKAKTLLSLSREDGLITTFNGKVTREVLQSIHLHDHLKDIVDWPEGERDGYDMRAVNTVVNAFHYRALRLMAKIAHALNRRNDEDYFKIRSEQVKFAINTKLFDENRGLYIDGEGSRHASLHANMFPLAFGLVPEVHLQTVTDFIKSRGMACSVYGAQYLMEALYRAGEGEYALELLTDHSDRSWWNMIRSGSTITMEAWDIKYKPNLDWNHAWGAAPANIIPKGLWGIQPEKPGFSEFSVRPQFGNLKYSKIKIPTIKGPVRAEYRKAAGNFLLKVEIPFNTIAKIYLPNLNGKHRYHLNGRLCTGHGDPESTIIQLKPGKYRLAVPLH